MEAHQEAPQKLGPYRIVHLVGVGGLGKVYRAVDERDGRTVAIKLLHDQFANNKRFIGIFHRELLIMSSLNHKHIVSYLDSHFEPPNCYIVTQFVEGWSGSKFLKTVGRVPPLVAVSIVIDILQGIDHLHLHDTIHSDLSAANYMIDKHGRVYVTDFGLSFQENVEDHKEHVVGTPGYYSPEHIQDMPLSPQTDIYCAGLILYELVTGTKAVIASKDRVQVLASMKKIRLNGLLSSEPKMDKLLKRLIKDSLHIMPQKRLKGADHMMYRCYEILKHHKIRYSRSAILKFLLDNTLSMDSTGLREQDIYIGLIR